MIATNRVGIVFKCSPTVSYLHFESALRVFWISHTQTRKKRNIKLTTTPYKHRPPKRPKKGHIGRTGPGASIIIGGAGCGHQFGNKQTIICCRARFRDNHHHKSCLQLWTQSLAILSLIGERLLKVFWLKVFFIYVGSWRAFPFYLFWAACLTKDALLLSKPQQWSCSNLVRKSWVA